MLTCHFHTPLCPDSFRDMSVSYVNTFTTKAPRYSHSSLRGKQRHKENKYKLSFPSVLARPSRDRSTPSRLYRWGLGMLKQYFIRQLADESGYMSHNFLVEFKAVVIFLILLTFGLILKPSLLEHHAISQFSFPFLE